VLTRYLLPVLAAAALSAPVAQAENVVLRQDFDSFAADDVGKVGNEQDDGGAWKEFGKLESSPKVNSEEFFAAPGTNTGKSIRIIRDDSLVLTADFWLTGAWAAPLDAGKLRISFRVLRDSPESCFSVHLGTAEKNAGVNTIAVSVGGRSTSGEKVQVMKNDGEWETTGVQILAGSWTQVTMTMDLVAETYAVSVDGSPAAEAIPFKREGALRKISFLPAYPDANVSYIDDVEVAELD